MSRRPPQIDLATLLQQQNPQIDLRVHAHDTTLRNFVKAVANFKNKAITLIAERRSAQAAEIKRALEKAQLIEDETNQYKLKEIEMLATIEREKEERKDAEMSIAVLKRQLGSAREKRTALELELEQYRATTANLHGERRKENSVLNSRMSHTTEQLKCYEDSLRCVFEGIEKDQLLVRLTHIDPSNLDREFVVVIDLSDHGYKVLLSTPLLPTIPILLDELNSSRNLYEFIRRVRQLFAESVGGLETH